MQSRIPEKIANLDVLDIEQVVLAGGGVLELAGLRWARDIDLGMKRANVEHLEASDPARWHRKVHRFKRIRDDTTFERVSLHDTDEEYDIWQHWYHAGRPQGDRLISIDEMKANAWQHKLGFYVLHLPFLMEMKAWADRPTDRKDWARYVQSKEFGY